MFSAQDMQRFIMLKGASTENEDIRKVHLKCTFFTISLAFEFQYLCPNISTRTKSKFNRDNGKMQLETHAFHKTTNNAM